MLYRKWGSKEDKVVTYTSSSREDVRILDKVKQVMKAHVIELFLSGNITKDEARKLLQGINSFTRIDPSYEDVHEALEDHLIKTAGEAGGSIGLGRSRNDHVATALRLEMREELLALLEQLLDFRGMILKRAEENLGTPFVVYTHFQPAQPTSFGHYLLYVEEEVASRWSSIYRTLDLVNRSPLGSGAIVGSSVNLNRDRESTLLGFKEVLVNTISATSSRADLISSVMEVVNLMLALSRIVEDMILLSSKFVGILELPDTHVSTSSLMPQKRNAVTMEVFRARVSRVLGDLMSIASTYKSLPSGYNLDLQEVNPLLWEVLDETRTGVEVLHDLLTKVRVKEFKMDKEILSTDEAEILSGKGIRYRDAYFTVAKAVREGKFSPTITPEQSVSRKAVKGSPSPERMREGISLARERLNGDANLLREYKNWILKGEGELRLMENDILQEGN
ncbi:Argininosuccinate lyase [Metallosphaera sp. J1]|uniref:argininosuccinate lyase n=1 Tax=Metallosphaera javensis (ex Hofmann et al. 2022) TaxID=99938 RepID=UPI001EDF6696|nr:argininosuccinate lyase [Metallosphaera javensis (ex Hofmann et al. 2022)]MCG3108631.1 Argininosuccinate lyase [Metallosphaera javensis (ex Hofmann et al. 2022)]